MKLTYEVENLDCPHCAAKIESGIRQIETVEEASLSLPAGKLFVTAPSGEGLLAQIQAVSDGIEEGVIFREARPAKKARVSSEKLEELRPLLIGAALFVIGLLLRAFKLPVVPQVVLLAAYFVMGWEVLSDCVKSLKKGDLFDENFLMSLSTLGAIAIGCFEEAAGVMLFFRIGELFEHFAVEKSRKSVMDAVDMRPETVQLLVDGKAQTVPAEEVMPGSAILVRAGDRVPLDGIVRQGESTLDTAAMTGEPLPLEVKPGDKVMSGCVNLSGVLEVETTAALSDSMVQRILDSVENAAAGKPKIDRFITRFSKVYTPAVVAVAVLTAIVPPLFTGDWEHWLYTALNFLMISCPCALVLSVPLAFFAGIGAGASKGILFKDGASLEALDKVKAVVMDKTGTLTEGRFSVIDVEGDAAPLLRYTAACEQFSTHPVASCMVQYARAQGISIPDAEEVHEIAGKGLLGRVEGKDIACGNEKLMAMVGIEVPASPGTCVYTAVDGVFLGKILLADTIKPGAKETVSALQSRGLHTVMLTGDAPARAKEIADTLGIEEVHAGLLPDEKPERMKAVRKAKGAVMFVGDGINDAPVLSGADVGCAMGSGADAAMEAADVVLLGSDPRSLLTALSLARRVNQTAQGCIIFALAIKFLIMLAGFLGFASMWVSVFADTGVTILCVLFVLLRIHK